MFCGCATLLEKPLSTEAPTETLGELIDKLYQKRTERLALSKQVDAFKAEESDLRRLIIQRLQDVGLDSGRGSLATASITTDDQASVKDWEAFENYILEHKSFDLLQRRVSITAVRARWENSEVVPGVEKVTLSDLSLTKASKGLKNV